jgi:AraC family transcriptional regulator
VNPGAQSPRRGEESATPIHQVPGPFPAERCRVAVRFEPLPLQTMDMASPSSDDTRIANAVRAGGFLVRQVAYAPHLTMPAHAHEQGSATLVIAGAIREVVGRTEEIAGPLSVVVKPAGVIHSDTFGPRGATTLQVVVLEGDLDLDRWMTRWGWHHAGVGARALVLLARALNDLPATERALPSAVESRVWEALAALAPGHAAGAPPSAAAPRWLERVRERIDDALAAPLDVRELAGTAGVHPMSLARAFRRHYGESVTGYRARRRLRKATEMLASGNDSISATAHAWGFADHAHFCRTFRRTTGVTPTEYRRLTRGMGRAVEPAPALGASREA